MFIITSQQNYINFFAISRGNNDVATLYLAMSEEFSDETQDEPQQEPSKGDRSPLRPLRLEGLQEMDSSTQGSEN